MTSGLSLARRGALLLALPVLAAACSASASIGGGTIHRSDIEKKAVTQLKEAAHTTVTPKVECPDDLDAKVGAKEDCVLSVAGETARYAVHVTVESVKDDTYHLDFKVADSPL